MAPEGLKSWRQNKISNSIGYLAPGTLLRGYVEFDGRFLHTDFQSWLDWLDIVSTQWSGCQDVVIGCINDTLAFGLNLVALFSLSTCFTFHKVWVMLNQFGQERNMQIRVISWQPAFVRLSQWSLVSQTSSCRRWFVIVKMWVEGTGLSSNEDLLKKWGIMRHNEILYLCYIDGSSI